MGSSQAYFLVVEDDALIRKAVGRAAQDLMEVRFAETGSAAVAALQAPALPRFVLLDHGLPDIDGLEVLRRVRADPRCAALPILMFSSLKDPARMEAALEAGADAWIPKPDDPARLRETVRALCLERGGGGNGSNGSNGNGAALAEPASARAAPAHAGPSAFRLLWHGRVVATAQGCSGLARTTDAVEEEAAGDAPPGAVARRWPGRTRFAPVLLHGVSVVDEAFDAWAAHLGEPLRRDLVLQVCDPRGEPLRGYTLSGCWPSAYEARVDPGPGTRLRSLRLEIEGWRPAARGAGLS